MTTRKILITSSILWGFITLLTMFLSFLALTDIYHQNEPNLDTEWSMVGTSYFVTLMFVGITFLTLWRLKKGEN